MSISVCESLGNEKVLQKVPKDAKEDWESLCETLVEIHKVATNSSPSVVVEEAIGDGTNYIFGPLTKIGHEGKRTWKV